MKRATNQGRTGAGAARTTGGRSQRRGARDSAAGPGASTDAGRDRAGEEDRRGRGGAPASGGARQSSAGPKGQGAKGRGPSAGGRRSPAGGRPSGEGGEERPRRQRPGDQVRAARPGAGDAGRREYGKKDRSFESGEGARPERRRGPAARSEGPGPRAATRSRPASRAAGAAGERAPARGARSAAPSKVRAKAARAKPVSRDSTAPRALADAPALRRAERAAASAKPGKRSPAATPDILRPAKVRLQKALAAAGVTSRRKAEELIAAGAIRVNGKVVKELGTKVDPDRDAIEVRGTRVQLEKKVYFVLNKPDGVVCSAEGPKDAEGRPTVLSLFPDLPQRIYPVGRLDFHTRGVLILTNDGDLAAALTHPRHEIPKTYHVKFQGKLTDGALEALTSGVTLEDGTVTRPAAEVSIIKETATNSWVQITLRQGLNRQIRRMGEAIGHPVLKLIRVAVAGLTADGLADGEFRPLTPTEVYDLMAAATPPAHPKPRPRAGAVGEGRERSRLAPRKRAG